MIDRPLEYLGGQARVVCNCLPAPYCLYVVAVPGGDTTAISIKRCYQTVRMKVLLRFISPGPDFLCNIYRVLVTPGPG